MWSLDKGSGLQVSSVFITCAPILILPGSQRKHHGVQDGYVHIILLLMMMMTSDDDGYVDDGAYLIQQEHMGLCCKRLAFGIRKAACLGRCSLLLPGKGT